MSFTAPVQAEERVQVHARRNIFDADAVENSWPPERRLRNRQGWYNAARRLFSLCLLRCLWRCSRRFLQSLPQRLFLDALNKGRTFFSCTRQPVNDFQSLNGLMG